MRYTALFAAIATAATLSCTGPGHTQEMFGEICYSPQYAGGFEIRGCEECESRVIRVRSRWQGSDSTNTELFISRNGEMPPAGFEGKVIKGEACRIAAMSSSHIAMLDAIGEVSRIKAVSGLNFISNGYIRSRKEEITDIGHESDTDFEALVSTSPDLVLLYSISSASPMENRLESLGIPYLYVGEYLEPDPLGKCEWMVALAEIAGCREKGEAAFRRIETAYNRLKSLVGENIVHPTVMLNTPYGDTWYMTSVGTAMARMINDAGADYVYKDNRSNKSLPIDMEKAYRLAAEADFWLNTGSVTSVKELVSAYPKFSDVRSVQEKTVFNNDKRAVEGGGNDFWESGSVRPDLVLKDLILIFHPELLPRTEEMTYYRRLQ